MPWIHLHGDIRGDYALCCHTDSHLVNGKPLRSGYSHDTPLKVWNNDYMKEVRSKFLRGEYPEECSVCYDKEKVGITSHRININQQFSEYSKLQEHTSPDGSIKTPPIYLDFRFGNTCNFRCRMCGVDSSTSWYKERNLSFGSHDSHLIVDKWTSNEDFWADFEKIIPYIEFMYFAGGEPFVQEGHYKALELLIKHKKFNVTLQYNSNLSYKKFKHYDIKELWSKFKKVELWPSIEGYEKQAEYGRKGLNWNTFTDNLEHFRQYIDNVSVTSSIYSISTIPELIYYLKNRGIGFHITNLTFPYILSTTVLPNNAKKDIILKFKKLIDSNILEHYEIENVKGALKYLTSKNDSSLLPQFKKYTQDLDQSRSESFESVYPEFASWYKTI